MCLVKTPKITNPTPSTSAADKPLPVLGNSQLDGFDPLGAARIGQQSLLIPRAGSAASRPTPYPGTPSSSLKIQSS